MNDNGPDTEEIEAVKDPDDSSNRADTAANTPNWKKARQGWPDTRKSQERMLQRSVNSQSSDPPNPTAPIDSSDRKKKRKKRQRAASLLQYTKQEVRISPAAYEAVQKRFDATGIFYSNNLFPVQAIRQVARWTGFSVLAIAALVAWCFTLDLRIWREQFWQETDLAVVIVTAALCGAVFICFFMTYRDFDKYRRNVRSVDESNLTIGHPGSKLLFIERTIKPFSTARFLNGHVYQSWTEQVIGDIPFIRRRFGRSTTTTLDFFGDEDESVTHNMRYIRDGEELFAAVDLSSRLNQHNHPLR